MRFYNPVIYFEENIIFTQGGAKTFSNINGLEAWAVYKIQGKPYLHLDNRGKISMMMSDSRAYKEAYSEAQILQIPKLTKSKNNTEFLKSFSSGELKEVAVDYFDELQKIYDDIEEKQLVNEYDVYLLIKLKKQIKLKEFKDIFKSFAKDPIDYFNSMLGFEVNNINIKEYESFKLMEKQIYNKIKTHINIQQVDEFDIEKLIKDPYWRGLEMQATRSKEDYFDFEKVKTKKGYRWKPACDVIKYDGEEYLRPHKRDITTLHSGIITNRLDHIKIKQKNGVSYQKTIAIASLPDLDFPSESEWIYLLRHYCDFPIWCNIRYDKKEYKDVLKELNKRAKDLEDQEKHNEEIEKELSQAHIEQTEGIEQAKKEVEQEKKPFLYTTVNVTVAGKTIEEIEKRIHSVQTFFELLDIETYLPSGEQLSLFYDSFVGNRRMLNDYIQRFPPEALASSMVTACVEIGSERGIRIGTTYLGKPVYFDPFEASRVNQSPSIAVTGGMGGGKSTAINNLSIVSVMMGAKLLLCDPKGDRYNWGECLTEIKDHINYIDLKPGQQEKGKLDIFSVLMNNIQDEEKRREISKIAAEYALSILGTLAGYKSTDEKMEYLADAVNHVARISRNPSMMKIIERLEVLADESITESERIIYSRLAKTFKNILETTAYGQLLFGSGHEESVNIQKPINIINTQKLIIPPEGKGEEQFTFQERVGMATLICLGAIGMQFCTQDRSTLKIYVQDEASIFKRSSEGKALFNRMIKMGRSENAPIVLIGQNVSDIGDSQDVFANIGTKFAFRTGSDAEANNILEFLGIRENKEKFINILTGSEEEGGLTTGECLMRDIRGRVGIVSFEILIERYLKAFDTKPQ